MNGNNKHIALINISSFFFGIYITKNVNCKIYTFIQHKADELMVDNISNEDTQNHKHVRI